MATGEKDEESSDYAQGSGEDEQTAAPSGKETLTESDRDLPEDQLPFQVDST